MRADNIDEKGLIYGKWQVMKNTWVLQYKNSVCAHLLIGEEKALLIDTMYGEGNLREFVEGITDKPVMVANTHGHFDHTGGNAFWEEAWMSEEAAEDCKHAFGEEMQARFEKMPHPDYTVHALHDGDIIDLGGRKILCIHIGAHHLGSMAYLDESTGALYSGDELEAGQVLLMRRDRSWQETVQMHLATMEKLAAHADEIKAIWPCHNGNPLIPQYLFDYIELDKKVLAEELQPEPDLAGYGMGPGSRDFPVFGGGNLYRYQYGGASIIIRQ